MDNVRHPFSDRSDTEQALLATQARHSAVLDAAFDAIVTMDHAGRIVDFNDAHASHALLRGGRHAPRRIANREQRLHGGLQGQTAALRGIDPASNRSRLELGFKNWTCTRSCREPDADDDREVVVHRSSHPPRNPI